MSAGQGQSPAPSGLRQTSVLFLIYKRSGGPTLVPRGPTDGRADTVPEDTRAGGTRPWSEVRKVCLVLLCPLARAELGGDEPAPLPSLPDPHPESYGSLSEEGRDAASPKVTGTPSAGGSQWPRELQLRLS